MKAHVRAGDLASGFSLLRKMEDERLQPDTVIHTILIDGLVETGKLEAAWEELLKGLRRTRRNHNMENGRNG